MRTERGRRRYVLASAAAALVGTVGFELVKETFLPALTRWGSHALTIVFVTLGAASIAALVHEAAGRLWRELEAAQSKAGRKEAALQAFIDAIPEPAFLVDRQLVVLTLNDALATRLGRTQADVRGQNVFSLLPDADLGRARAAQVSEVFERRERLVFRDSRRGRHYVNHVCPVRGPDGDVWAVGIVAVDVTDLHTARADLESKEELLRFGLEAAHLGVWEWDIGTDVVGVSPEAIQLFGGPERPWRGPFAAFINQVDVRDRARVEESLRSCAAGRLSTEPLVFRGTPNARRPMRWLEVQGRLFKSGGGRPRMVGTVGDATTKIESEARRQRAEQAVQSVTHGTAGHTGQGFFSSLVEALACSLGTRWVLAGRFKDGGGAFETMACWADGPATNAAFTVDDGPNSVARRWLARRYDGCAAASGEAPGASAVIEVPIVAPDGRRVGLVATLDDKPFADVDTLRLVLALSAVRAGAEIERLDREAEIMRLNADLERRVAERTQELTAANRELEAFSYSVSHDLRAPLRSIDGFALALIEDHGEALDPGARQYIDIVRQESQRMGQLIDDLLGLARLSRGTLQRGDVDVSAVAADIVEELRRREARREIEIEIAPEMRLRGDANLLRIALENLIGNAWKFTSRRPGARVSVGMTSDGQHRSLTVTDNGAGFDPRLAAKLFQPFARLHPASEYEGTGIGLATVARIIKRHGGSVRAESQPGQGATFICALPDSAPTPELGEGVPGAVPGAVPSVVAPSSSQASNQAGNSERHPMDKPQPLL